MRITNKKFKFIFLNQNFIKPKSEKKKLEFILSFFLYFNISDVEKLKNEKFNLKKKKNFFDDLFNKEILKFTSFLKFKLQKYQKIETNLVHKKKSVFTTIIKDKNQIKKNSIGKKKKFQNKLIFFDKKIKREKGFSDIKYNYEIKKQIYRDILDNINLIKF